MGELSIEESEEIRMHDVQRTESFPLSDDARDADLTGACQLYQHLSPPNHISEKERERITHLARSSRY